MKYLLMISFVIFLSACDGTPSVSFTPGEEVYLYEYRAKGTFMESYIVNSGRWQNTMAKVQIEYMDSTSGEKKKKVVEVYVNNVSKIKVEKEK